MKEFDHAALLDLSERLPEWEGAVLAAQKAGTGIQIDIDEFDEPDLLHNALIFATSAGVPISTVPSQDVFQATGRKLNRLTILRVPLPPHEPFTRS
ncbi:hypothetical protein [Streptomyces xylophagus]|uniref:hypothetical protein n=1 Tax=Streptomyces xylophagus TaxID=285514 RepID=UPI00131E98CB|nr:hypothetical protein [Streptomyces xylophagus]